MSAVRHSAVLLVFVGALLALAGCQGGDTAGQGKFQWQPLFGDFTTDASEPAAKVGDIVITERMVELFIDELPPQLKSEYTGADGNRLALKKMIDQVLMVQGAMEQKIYNDQDVARQLIAQRRNTLDYAMRNYGLLRDNKPSDEDLRKFFDDNKDDYRQQGLVLTRHIELMNKADADLAYERLMTGEYKNNFPHVLGEMSVNEDTKAKGGNTGWFAKGGFIPFIRNSESYANQVFDLEIGIHPPIKVADRWHVVDVVEREYARPQTFTEAKNKLMQDMLPGWQDAIIKDYLLAARKKYPVQMLGEFAPGKGASADDLFARAVAMPDHDKKLEVLSMIYTDYPHSGRADDALFMSANVALEAWQDRRIAERYLDMLIEQFPDSELIEDAKFMRKNMYNPKVMNPQSIEDLKQN